MSDGVVLYFLFDGFVVLVTELQICDCSHRGGRVRGTIEYGAIEDSRVPLLDHDLLLTNENVHSLPFLVISRLPLPDRVCEALGQTIQNK